jgi:hypothetical protein
MEASSGKEGRKGQSLRARCGDVGIWTGEIVQDEKVV